MKAENIIQNKKQLYLTGTILSPLRPGEPAVYICNGKAIRTSKVMVILEAAPTYVKFETVDCIYTIFAKSPVESCIAV